MSPYWEDCWGNPSSRQNRLSLNASAAISLAREQLSSLLKVSQERLIFTSGATESNNLALLGYARANYFRKGSPGHLITLATEHYAVLEPLRQLRKEGFSVSELSPNKDGLLLLEDLVHEFRDNTFLVSVMAANNEIGVIQPIENISKICKSREIIFHSDFAQCLGYIEFNDLFSDVNMITISSHKIYGPKGIGLLLIDDDIDLQPLIFGGGHEYGFRSGTLPLPLIVGFTKAIEIAVFNQKKNAHRLLVHRDTLLKGLLENNSGLLINGSIKKRLPHNLN